MGIKGLLPFLSKSQRDVNVSSFRGQTAAIDAYCWLHKGAYSCALQLVMKTEKCENLPFVRYCMKRIHLLRQNDITPIVVFDGANLPMKRNTENERRERRKSFLQKGKALMKDGRQSEAIDCFQRCIDISPEMALAFIRELRKYDIQVVVAPYEADAQLAYLVKQGIAHFVITEDSDLLAFGCSKVLFKMTDNGDGKLIEFENIGKSIKSLVGFTPDSFRHVCILSGCDYLASIPGVGTATAVKLMRKHNKDPYNVIKGLRRDKKNRVPPGYEEEFSKADETFLYQIVFDLQSQTQVRLTTPPMNSELTSVGM